MTVEAPIQRVEDFLACIRHGKKLCVFGAGLLARTRTRWYLDYFGLQPVCYCDNNRVLWGKELYGLPCLSPDELEAHKDAYAVLNSVGLAHCDEVAAQLQAMGVTDWMFVRDIYPYFSTDTFLARWIGVEALPKYQRPTHPAKGAWFGKSYPQGDRIAVYTAISGGYDIPLEPLCFPHKIDYFLVTDRPQEAAEGWTVIDMDTVVPSNVDRSDGPLMNRYCKLHGRELFPSYRYSIYIDGCIRPKVDISDYVRFISDIGFTTFPNPLNPDAYVEGFSIGTLGDYDDVVPQIRAQLRRYAREGCPRTPFGIQGTVIVRDHDNATGNAIFADWYEEFKNGVRRDQLPATYVMWKHGVDFERYTRLPAEGLYKDFEAHRHPGYVFSGHPRVDLLQGGYRRGGARVFARCRENIGTRCYKDFDLYISQRGRRGRFFEVLPVARIRLRFFQGKNLCKRRICERRIVGRAERQAGTGMRWSL